MDVLACLDYLNSCFWNLPSLVASIFSICSYLGTITSTCSACCMAVSSYFGPIGMPEVGRFLAACGSCCGVISVPCSLLGGGGLATLFAWIIAIGYTLLAVVGIGLIPYIGRICVVCGTCLGGIVGSIGSDACLSLIGNILSPITATCESLIHNLIGIIGSPIIIRAAFLDGCLKEFLTACLDLIRHLM